MISSSATESVLLPASSKYSCIRWHTCDAMLLQATAHVHALNSKWQRCRCVLAVTGARCGLGCQA